MTATAESALPPERTTTLRRGTLPELAQRLERLRESTKDLVVDSRSIVAEPTEQHGIRLHLPGDANFPYTLTQHAKGQVAEKTGFPLRYWQACEEAGAPGLVAENLNYWFQHQTDRRLVRIADGRVRALLSDRFRALDNYDLAMTVADRALAHKAQVLQCDLTDTHMAIKLTVPEYRAQVLAGDDVVPGILVTNSEVGAAAFRVEAFVWRLVCKNGLVSERAFHQVHVGAKLELGEVQWQNDTRAFVDGATWRQVRDIVDATFSGQGKFQELLTKLRGATEIPIAKPIQVVDTVARNLSLTEEAKTNLLRYFAVEGDTVYGLVNGLTRLAQYYEDPVQQIEMERFAGNMLAKPELALA